MLRGMFVMKKCKLFIVSIVVSFSLVSAPILAGPTVKDPPRAEAQVESGTSFSEWFFSLFDF
jgi:hypothetical protein